MASGQGHEGTMKQGRTAKRDGWLQHYSIVDFKLCVAVLIFVACAKLTATASHHTAGLFQKSMMIPPGSAKTTLSNFFVNILMNSFRQWKDEQWTN